MPIHLSFTTRTTCEYSRFQCILNQEASSTGKSDGAFLPTKFFYLPKTVNRIKATDADNEDVIFGKWAASLDPHLRSVFSVLVSIFQVC